MALHVGFGGWSSVDAGVSINEGEIPALFFGESGLARGVTGIGGLIHQSFFQQRGSRSLEVMWVAMRFTVAKGRHCARLSPAAALLDLLAFAQGAWIVSS